MLTIIIFQTEPFNYHKKQNVNLFLLIKTNSNLGLTSKYKFY